MEAKTILYKIRHRGFTMQPVGNNISLWPKRLLNDRMMTFVKQHKAKILTALYQERDEEELIHQTHKQVLRQGRLVILHNLIKQCYGNNWKHDAAHWQAVEDLIDRELKQNEYDLEKIIDHYRKIAPPPAIYDPRCKCGYIPPFCVCNQDITNSHSALTC